MGFTRTRSTYRLRSGDLIAVHHGVYAVGHLPTNPIDQAKGAVLACGPRTALGFSAARRVLGRAKTLAATRSSW